MHGRSCSCYAVAVGAATDLPAGYKGVWELRRGCLLHHPQVDKPGAPPSYRFRLSSPTTAAGRHRLIRRLPCIPDPYEPSISTAVSISIFPLSLLAQSRPLASVAIATLSSLALAMLPSSLWLATVQTEHTVELLELLGGR